VRPDASVSGTLAIRKLYNNIDWIKKESLPENTMYFCAQYRQEYPARNGGDYLVLDAEGKGYYVGTVYAVRTRSPSWFGEGDEKIYIEDEAVPNWLNQNKRPIHLDKQLDIKPLIVLL
jgi:hypothetical protein